MIDTLLSHFKLITEFLLQPNLLIEDGEKVLFTNEAAIEFLGISMDENHYPNIKELIDLPWEKISSYLKVWSISRAPLPASFNLKTQCGNYIACRIEAGILEPAGKETSAKIHFRFNKKISTIKKFEFLNQSIKINALLNEITEQELIIKQYERKLKIVLNQGSQAPQNPIQNVPCD